MKKELPIPFRLAHIEEIQYAVFPESYLEDAEVKENVGFAFGANLQENVIAVHFQYMLEIAEKPLLKIELACYFEIKATDFKQLHKEATVVVLPCHFAKHLSMITIGTGRGVLYANTKNTILNQFFIGLVDVDAIFTTDVVLAI